MQVDNNHEELPRRDSFEEEDAESRSILDLGIDDLEVILSADILPPGVNLAGIEGRPDFDKLYRHRLHPRMIAQVLLKERLKARIAVEPDSLKTQRLEIKKMELEIKEKKLQGERFSLQAINKKLQTIESGQTLIISSLSVINQRLEKIQANKEEKDNE